MLAAARTQWERAKAFVPSDEQIRQRIAERDTTAQQLIAKGVWSLQASNVALVMNDMELYGAIKANYPTNVVINDAGKSSDTVE